MKKYFKIAAFCQLILASQSIVSATNLQQDDLYETKQANVSNTVVSSKSTNLRCLSQYDLKQEAVILNKGIKAFNSSLKAIKEKNQIKFFKESKKNFEEAISHWGTPVAYLYLSVMGDDSTNERYLGIALNALRSGYVDNPTFFNTALNFLYESVE